MLQQMRDYGQTLLSRSPEGNKARQQLAKQTVFAVTGILGLFQMAGCAVYHDGPVYRGRPVPANTYWREETIYVQPPVRYNRYETYDDRYDNRDRHHQRDRHDRDDYDRPPRGRYDHRDGRDQYQSSPRSGGGRWPAGSDGHRSRTEGSGKFNMKLKID